MGAQTVSTAGLGSTVGTSNALATLRLAVGAGEQWWGGAVVDGVEMPFTAATTFSRNLADPGTDAAGEGLPSNQIAPWLISSHGRVLVGRAPFAYSFTAGTLEVHGEQVRLEQCGQTLASAYRGLAAAAFDTGHGTPALELISTPQYNTWIEMPYTPTQDSVLEYVERLLNEGMAPGVVFIDDNWAPSYGALRFDRSRFPNPRALTDRLHALGCTVMLWLVPFISPDSPEFRELEGAGLLVRDRHGQTAVRRWWNGLSALLDISHPRAVDWLRRRLDALIDECGVDGFKFDAGDIRDYRSDDSNYGGLTPHQMCQRWAEVAAHYPFNEMRACWRAAGMPLGQRLEDKPPAWGPVGIGSLIPNVLAQAMLGHPFTCPDMIGGGEIKAMTSLSGYDQEFFVRYAQVAALLPMIQFSASPRRVLDDAHFELITAALKLRARYLPLILERAEQAGVDASPIVAPLSYFYPGAPAVNDQFLLGPDLIVAPVVEQGASTRQVALPRGNWRDDRAHIHRIDGDFETVTVAVDLARIPLFERVED